MDLTKIEILEISPVINENHNCDVVLSFIDDDNYLQMISLLELSEKDIHDLFSNNSFIEKYMEAYERSKVYKGSIQKLRNLNWNTLSFNDVFEEFEDNLSDNEKVLLEVYKN